MNIKTAWRQTRWWSIVAFAGMVVGCAEIANFSQGSGSVSTAESADRSVEEIIVTGSSMTRGMMGKFASAQSRVRTDENAIAFSGDEEIWVIQKANQADRPLGREEPGTGSLLTTVDSLVVPLPLQHTDVNAQINGYISAVTVQQVFSNPFDRKIEAVYVFPLPQNAAITEFVMTIGERRIRGILREKEHAKEIYEQARSQGYRASLLQQLRPNVFEQKVANIEPGKSIDIDIKYFHTLAYNDGWYSFVFPTVVGPRYNPPGSTQGIDALTREHIAPDGKAVRYLRPDERSGHDISINVQIDAGLTIETIRSTHAIDAVRPEEHLASVQLQQRTTIPNRDFVLDFQVAGKKMKSALLSYIDPKTQQGYFTLMLHPPAAIGGLPRRNMEMVFVIDTSGSMNGTPIEQARDAVSAALDHLQEGDTFQIIRFSDNASQFGPSPVPATAANLQRARHYLARLSGGGGTQMIEGIRASLDFPSDPSRLRFVSFLTDGYIGNEADILNAVAARIGTARIFIFGVGSSVNRYLMDRLAQIGRGAVAYLGPQDSGYEVMRDFFARVSHPALTDLDVDWQGMAISDVYPAQLPDVFVGRPIIVTGKFIGSIGDVVVNGHYGEDDRSIRISHDSDAPGAPSLAKIWARRRIADLSDRLGFMPDRGAEMETEILTTALQHQLMSDYTSFVAVDSSQPTSGQYGTTVHQAVPVPAGVRYETTVEQH